jgi:hypothetical protein
MEKAKFQDLITKVSQWQNGPDWAPRLEDFDIANCFYYDSVQVEKNMSSEKCAKIREVNK